MTPRELAFERGVEVIALHLRAAGRAPRGWSTPGPAATSAKWRLAAAAGRSKRYLSAMEAGEVPRPSGETLYAIAEALGVTMSDLLGRRLLSQPPTEIPPSLLEFAAEHHLPEADVRMLAAINFRGGQPRTRERWAHIYSAIRQTQWMDEDQPD